MNEHLTPWTFAMRMFAALISYLLLATAASAQNLPAQPPAPKQFKAIVRYRIAAPRDIHVAFYDAMVLHLKRLGFQFDPPLEQRPRTDREDRSKNLMIGLVSADKALHILDDPSAASLLLIPEDFKLPEDPKNRVLVRLELSGDLPPGQHRELGNQVRPLLALANFVESAGYDTRGYSGKPFTRMVGSIPSGQLDLLVKDFRSQPSNWFSRVFPVEELPLPLRKVNPFRMIEVMADAEPTPDPARPASRGLSYLDRIADDLWALVGELKEEDKEKAARVQVILSGAPSLDDKTLRFSLQTTASSLNVDGMLGPVITGSIELGQVRDLAGHPQVSTLRLARPFPVNVDPTTNFPTDNAAALEKSGLFAMHKKGAQGQGVKVVVVDTDFRGWEKLVREKKLPTQTRHIDLTTERDLELFPAPYPGGEVEIGHGAQCARAVALAAPKAEILLVRVDGYDPYQLFEVVRYIRGGSLSETLNRRREEIFANRDALRRRREQLLGERTVILENFEDESDIYREFGFLGPVVGWIYSDRLWIHQQLEYQQQLETALAERYQRFLRVAKLVPGLEGSDILVTALRWQDGFPVGGASGLSRFAATLTKGKPIWIQSAGNTRGQAWTDVFRDDNQNGTLEFVPLGTPLPKNRWTPEVAFLGFQPFGGELQTDLPEQGKLRLAFQWREPHDPAYFTRSTDDDPYRQPLAEIQLSLLRQRDPEAKELPADVFELTARSAGIPQRLENLPNYSIYEQIFEVTLPKPGRYAVRVDRQLPTRWIIRDDSPSRGPLFQNLTDLAPSGLRPVGVPTLPALERNWEMSARLFVDLVDEVQRPRGRPVLLDFATDQGTVGIPGDSRGVVTVGAAKLDKTPQPYSAIGPVAFSEMSFKPDLLAFDALDVAPDGQRTAFGTSLAAAFTAGYRACELSVK